MLAQIALPIAVLTSFAVGAPAIDATDAKNKRRPADFAVIFQMGYGGDHFPSEPAAFEKLLEAVVSAHYNTILCKHTPWREELCHKYDVKMMVDLLAGNHHVYKNPEGAADLCKSLRDSETVYAYHIWSDRVGGTIAGRNRDITNVHEWDPNHPVYVGDYNARAIGGLENPDLVGYYDFHWSRGGHWRHLQRAREAATKTDSRFLKYVDPAPGRVGAGNYNRVLYTISMSVACGLKGYTFHHTGGEIDKTSWQWKTLGEDLAKVNAMIAPLGPELIKLDNPTAVYSTPITLTAKNRPTGADPAVPAEFEPIPADAPVQITSGEAVMGVYEADQGRRALVFANHNAYEAQPMELQFRNASARAVRFDRESRTWKRLATEDGKVRFELPPAAAELVLVDP